MDYSLTVREINNIKGFDCFKKPEKKDLNYLISLNLPEDVLDFYSQYSPIGTIEINNIRFLPISEILAENTNYTPGYILKPLDFCVVATTIEGDVYCIRKTTTSYFIVIASHDEIYENQSLEEILSGTKKVAETFADFLKAFVRQDLVISFYDLEEQ
jgi:hypothetical protein